MQLAIQHATPVQGYTEAVEVNAWIEQVTAWRKEVDAEYSALILEIPRLQKAGQDYGLAQDRLNKIQMMRSDLLAYIESILKARLEHQLQVIPPFNS